MSCSRISFSQMMQQLLSVVFVFFLADRVTAAHPRSVRRLCKNDIDLMSDEGVHIEPVDRSHVELILADKKVRNRHVIKFEFRSTEPNGVLFYGRSRDSRREGQELLALRLMGGDLYYKIHCSTVSADVLIPHRHKLSDGRWHSVVVRFRRGGTKTQIEVDGIKDSKTYQVGREDIKSLVFGGVSPQDKELVGDILGYVPHFEGCIRRVNIPNALRSPPKYYAISICEQ